MKILNLGAGGFIGSHLTQRLLAEGHNVTAVDLWTDKVSELLDHPRLSFVQQDIRSPDWNLDELVADADLVIDLIAHANPGLYIRIPLEVFHLNFEENLKIAETCVRHRKRLIQFSTCEVYGRTAASLKNARVADPEDPIHATFPRINRSSFWARLPSIAGSTPAPSNCSSACCMRMVSKTVSTTPSSGLQFHRS
jgi:nucleoside-diphosphate-sugar epimerase